MNIHELDSYDLGDAVKFNDRLNPRIWGADEKMRPEVREQLLRIADDFREFLGIDVEVKDITVSGSNAAYTYTPHSDIDLHLVVDLPEADRNQVYRELFDAKKYAYNEQHDIKIGGYDVELYVQDANKPHHSQGIYSIMNDDWVSVPKRRRPDVDDISVKSKFEDLGHRIEAAIASGDYEKISAMAEKIKDYRQAGLDAHGEFGPENLAFKILRTQGLIKKLYDARNATKDELLSLDERRKKKKKKVRYGYGGYWYPGTAYAGQDHPAGTEGGGGGDGGGGDGGGESVREDAGMTWDGVNPSTAMFTTETEDATDEEILKDFIDFCVKELKIEHMPRVKLRRDPQWPQVHKTFGRYSDDTKTLEVAWGQRHIMDVLRTVAHELTHKHQHEREGHRMGPDAGETGSPYENEANARAGVLMRDYGRLHPEYFAVGQAHDLEESASGYIPTRAQAKDPRYSMALTVDIKPGQVGKEANKLKLKTNRQGHPQIAQANGLFENLYKEYKKYKADEDYSPDEPPGPEFKPTMPSGTLRVDVSDVYDWYKLGQHISNMKGLGRHDFGQGPPSSIISFGDEDTEHKFIGDIEATGLDVTDIDPKDPKKRPGRTIKTDPTYNVDETIQAPVGKDRDAKQYYDFIIGKARLGRPLTRQEQDYVKMYQMYRQQKLAEGAPPPGLVVKKGGDWSERYPGGFQINAFLPNNKHVGMMVVYPEDDGAWIGEHLVVDPEYQRQGIGTALWNFAEKTVGGPVTAINTTADGKKFQRSRKQAVAESVLNETQTVTRIDSKPITDFASNLKSYKHTDDWSQSGIDTGDDSYWQKRNIKTKVTKGLYAGDPHRTALYATGNAHETRYVEFTQNGQPIVYFDRKDLPKMRARKTYLTVFNAANFKKLPTGEYFSDNPGQPIKQTEIGDPFQYIANQGWIVRTTDNLDKVLKQVQAMHKAGKISQYGAEGMNESVEELDEVKMSPGALEKFATSDAAKGIRAGFEAELIFRDTQGESDEMDPEPDYDADERAYSIQQVIEFFENDEYGYGISDRQRNRLEEQLDETYMNWRDEQMMSDFRNEAEDLVREQHLDEMPMGERILAVLTDGMELTDDQAEKIFRLGSDAPRFKTSAEQEAFAEQNPDYRTYLEAVNDADAILDEEVEQSIEKQDGYYDQAIDEYRDSYSPDDSGFFSDIGLRWMSDIANEFNLDWPVWNMDARGNEGSRDWESIGGSLNDVVGMPVKVSSGYHSATRREGTWIIEPDGSLSPDDPSEEAGLEIVSPPMPLLTAIEKLKAVVDWANDPQGGNAYTNSSTGLHMGVSLPTMKSEGQDDDTGIDYVKLILFLGDKYVLQQFGRTANTYTASALDKLRQNIKGGRSDPAGVVTLLKHGLTELAHKELQKGVGTSKYTSAHIQPGYIEFRSPGGDWLAKADEEIGVLENTMMRFARAMAIAGDPNAERQEYAKKLYKLVTADNEQYADQLRLFSEFSAGTIDKEQLKKQWAEKTIGKEKQMNQRWKLYQKVNGTWTAVPGAEWNNYTEDQVKNAVWSKYGREALDTGEYQLVNMGEQEWEVYDVKTGQTLEIVKGKSKGEVADAVYDKYADKGIGFNVRPYEDPAKLTPRAKLAKRIAKPKTVDYNYDIIDRSTVELRVVDRFYATSDKDASETFDRWLKSKDLPADTDRYGYRKGRQAADDQRDSVAIQRRLGVQDVNTDVAQNFDPSAYERNSERIDAIRAQAQQPGNWEIYQSDDPSRIVNTLIDATERQVQDWLRRQETQGMPPGFLSARRQTTTESVHQPTPEQTQEIMDAAARELNFRDFNDAKQRGSEFAMKTIQHLATAKMDLAQKQPFSMLNKKPSSIKQAVDQVNLDHMTRQIQTARRLGDDVNENFADKKISGKSRPGRVKRAGASCAGSVTDLRARAKKYGGEKGKMYHWCANMKSGRNK